MQKFKMHNEPSFSRMAIYIACIFMIPAVYAFPKQTSDEFQQILAPYSKKYMNVFAYGGTYPGIDDRKNIDITHISVGAGYYIANYLGVYGELMAVTSRGNLNQRDADTEGIGGFFALRWHFLQKRNWSLYFNHGFGWVSFFDDFPPGGTQLNGLLQYSFGMTARLNPAVTLQLGVRSIHISNGRGLTDDNPSFDGNGIYIGVERPF